MKIMCIVEAKHIRDDQWLEITDHLVTPEEGALIILKEEKDDEGRDYEFRLRYVEHYD